MSKINSSCRLYLGRLRGRDMQEILWTISWAGCKENGWAAFQITELKLVGPTRVFCVMHKYFYRARNWIPASKEHPNYEKLAREAMKPARGWLRLKLNTDLFYLLSLPLLSCIIRAIIHGKLGTEGKISGLDNVHRF